MQAPPAGALLGRAAGDKKNAICSRIYAQKPSNKVCLNASRTSKGRGSGSEPNFLLFYYRQIEKGPRKKKTPAATNSEKGLNFIFAKGEFERQCFKFSFAYLVWRTKRPQDFFGPAPKKAAHPHTCVALRATRPSAAVAENGYFDQNIAPAQQGNR